MNHHRQLILLVLGIIAVPYITHAALGLSAPFGGRVLSVTIPSVTCVGTGTGPIVLTSTAVSVISMATSQNNASGVYGSIPLYATDANKAPRVGKWILGRHELMPSFSTCTIGGTPFPVKKTTNQYNVSGTNLGL
jgi:hypothetical protein